MISLRNYRLAMALACKSWHKPQNSTALTISNCNCYNRNGFNRNKSNIGRRCYATLGTPTDKNLLDDIKVEMRALGSGGGVTLKWHEDKDGLALITLVNEGRKNAMSGQMMFELHEAVLTLEEWSGMDRVKAVLVQTDVEAGGGGVFCSGGDLHTVRHLLSPDGGRRMAILMQDVYLRLSRLPVLTATLINGRAIGGGAELALLTDLRAFTPEGALRFVQSTMGVSPGWAAGLRLVKLSGKNHALRLLLSGHNVYGEEASKIGLCDAQVEDALEAEEWLWKIVGRLEPQVQKTIKAVVTNADREEVSIEEKLNEEAELFAQVWGGPAHLAAMNKRLKH